MKTTVRDLMCEDVVTVEPEMTMLELTRVLADTGIGGAPVVDRNGSLVGVVSGTDAIRLAADDAATAARVYPFDPAQVLDPDGAGTDEPGCSTSASDAVSQRAV